MKLLEIVPRTGMRLYGAMVRKQAEIRKAGRGTFARAGRRRANAARWKHVRYTGAVALATAAAGAVAVKIKSADHGDESRLLSAFLGWLDRHFGGDVRSVNIQYQSRPKRRRRR